MSDSLQEYGRGIAGGLLFSLPLLYTAEVWDAGFFIPPHRQLAYLLGTFVLLLGYNRYSGMHPDARWVEVVIDSVEEMGIGLVLGALLLFALGRLTPELRLDEVMGRVVVGALTVAIGVSVGTAQLGGDPEQRGADTREVGFGGEVVLGVCGAVLVAGNMAPTEEIVILGLELTPLRLAVLALVSLLLGLLILFFSDFRGTRRWAGSATGIARLRGAIVTYAVALFASAMSLWLFGRFDHVPLAGVVGQTVVLGVAASLGASAGRLLLQQ